MYIKAEGHFMRVEIPLVCAVLSDCKVHTMFILRHFQTTGICMYANRLFSFSKLREVL